MKQISSLTTGLLVEMPSQTGKQLGATGLETRAAISQAVGQWQPKVPAWLTETISEDLSSLISLANRKGKIDDKVSAHRRLAAALDRARRQLDAAGPDVIVKIMVGLANLFRSEVPDNVVLQMYVRIFQEIPEFALRQAAIDVAKTHKYPSMPLPADVLQHANKHVQKHNAWVYRLEMAVARTGYGLEEKHDE